MLGRIAGVVVALAAGVAVVAVAAVQGGWMDAVMTLLVAGGGAAFVVGVLVASRTPVERVHAEPEPAERTMLLH
jgi:hypothetical protein